MSRKFPKSIPEILTKIRIRDSQIETMKKELPQVTYLGGYCCYSVTKKK